MLERFVVQLPEWAQRKNPALRYELERGQHPTRRAQYLRAFGLIALLALLYAGGYVLATNLFQNPPGQNLTESLISVVFWPTLAIQVLTQVAALALTINTVSEQQRRQTWDNLRATEGGVALALRTRWATVVFYRLRPALAFVILVRILLIVGILYDLTAFQGRYIDLLINGITPEVSPIVAALLLAFMMTASLLLPLTSVGLEAAVGLLASVTIQQRLYSVMAQVIVIAIRLALVVGLMIAAYQFIRGDLALSDGAAWALMGGFAGFGDWGLLFLHLGFFSEIWATIPFGILLGIGLLIFSMAQSGLTEWILALAIRRAERQG